MKYLANPYSQLPIITYWFMGGFALADAKTTLVLFFPIVAGVLALLLLSPYLNVLTMGEEESPVAGGQYESVAHDVHHHLDGCRAASTVASVRNAGWVRQADSRGAGRKPIGLAALR